MNGQENLHSGKDCLVIKNRIKDSSEVCRQKLYRLYELLSVMNKFKNGNSRSGFRLEIERYKMRHIIED